MRILLDSHAFLWFVLRKPQLSRSADALISDPSNVVLVSPATCWEIAIKDGDVVNSKIKGKGLKATTSRFCPSKQGTRHF